MRIAGIVALSFAVSLPMLATEANPSKQQRAEIDKLFAAMNLDKTLHDTVDAMYAQIEKQYFDAAGEDPDAIAEAKERFAFFRERAAKIDFGGEFHEACTRLYAKYFSEDDLAALTAFYTSPTGRKAVEIMPQMMQEAMQVGSQHLGPQLEKAIHEADEAVEQKRPWRRTMRDMSTIAMYLDSYAEEHEGKYPDGEFAQLDDVLDAEELPQKDMWKHEYAYAVSDDHQHYRIVSAGADTVFEWDSRRVVPAGENDPPLVYKDRLEDDLIFADGQFIQLPMQAKPKG